MTLLVSAQPGAGEAWRSATGNLDRRWLRVMSDRPPGRFVCFTLRDPRGAEIACTTGYVVTDAASYAAFNWHSLLWSRQGVFPEQPAELTAEPAAQDCFPMLNLVQPGYDFGVHTAAAGAEETTDTLLAEICRWARDSGLVAVAALYADTALHGSFGRLGWARFRGADRAVATMAGAATFPEFVASLSRNARKQIRADGKVLSANRVSVSAATVSEHIPALLSLRADLVRKYGSYVDPAADAERIARLLGTYGDDGLRLFVAREPAATILGFALFVVTGDHSWASFWVGARRDDPRSDRVYFGCLFYAAVARALQNGVSRIDYGLGADDAKLRRGCQARERDIFVAPGPRAPIDPAAFEGVRRIR